MKRLDQARAGETEGSISPQAETTTVLLEHLRDRLTLTARDTARNFDSMFEAFARLVGAADLNVPREISTEETAAIVKRVKRAVLRNRIEVELVPQDARVALRSFNALTTEEAEALLRWIPKIGWKVLV